MSAGVWRSAQQALPVDRLDAVGLWERRLGGSGIAFPLVEPALFEAQGRFRRGRGARSANR